MPIPRVGLIVRDRHTRDCMAVVRSIWSELEHYGHDLSRVSLGIWEGPRWHEIKFLASGVVVESVALRINSASEFDQLRAFAGSLCGGHH